MIQKNHEEVSPMLTLGQLSEVTGVSYHTLDYYVREDLIWPKTRIGPCRMFGSDMIQRIKRIRELRECSDEYPNGIPIRKIRSIMSQEVNDQ